METILTTKPVFNNTVTTPRQPLILKGSHKSPPFEHSEQTEKSKKMAPGL